jgi:hypothetical protein
MNTRNTRTIIAILMALILSSTLFSGCESDPSSISPISPKQTSIPMIGITSGRILPFTINPGNFYFSVNAKQSFILSRNITGIIKDDFYTLLDWARMGGTKVIRLHIITGWGEPWINQYWSVGNAANALIGIQHAIWAGLVSGAMNGRSFWAVDGYSIYDYPNRNDALAFMKQFAATELPVARFTQDIDCAGFRPLDDTYSSIIWGAAIGNENVALGWYRDASCEPPNWYLRPVISGQTVTLYVPGNARNWKVDFYDTKTGIDIIYSTYVIRNGNRITITLPDFKDDIAFKLHVIT